MTAPTNHGAASSCAISLPPLPSGGGCKAAVPDCFNKTSQQLGGSLYTDVPTSSETAFYERYGATAKAASGGRRRGKRPRSRRHHSKRPSSRRSHRRSAPTTRTGLSRVRRARGGSGYYLDLSSCPPGGSPSRVAYDSKAPPYFGGAAMAKGAPCQPRTYAKGNAGYCNSASQ